MNKLLLKKIIDSRQSGSLASKMRRRRLAFFLELIADLQKPIRILDVGGTQSFWEMAGYPDQMDVKITLLNVVSSDVTHPNFTAVVGDATNMKEFQNEEFDVVFSNSVIEHIGDFEGQRRMAEEVRRVGKRYFLQTPNRYFPLEPHFVFPFFQFLPLKQRAFLVQHLSLGWFQKTPDKREATKIAASIRLLTKKEMQKLFPFARFRQEKLFGLTKSLMVYEGW